MKNARRTRKRPPTLAEFEDIFLSNLADEQGKRDNAVKSNRRIADSIRKGLTKKQLAVIKDTSRTKSAICPRRAGKSYTAMSYSYDTALRRPNARVVIITLTLKSAKNIYWWELQEFARRYGIEFDSFTNDLRIELDNGSHITLVGAESRAQLDKLRGSQYDLVIIDEAKSYPPTVLIELIDDVIDPALIDRRGTLLMIGTPGNILNGPFFEATHPGVKTPDGKKPFSKSYDEPEQYWRENPHDHLWRWSRHSWTMQDNPHLDRNRQPGEPTAWELALQKKSNNGWADDHPTWQREYLGRWVTSESAFVYSYAALVHSDPKRVTWEPDFENGNPLGLPHKGPWYYVMGMDIGFEDDFALVVCAYSPYDTTMYQVYEFKDIHQDLDQIAEHVEKAKNLVGGNFTAIVADTGSGGAKTLIETLNRRFGWNIRAAEKRDKFDNIEVLNTEFHAGRCKLLRHSNLSMELQMLQWDLGAKSKELLARTGKLREHPDLPNHLADALLYLWRFAYNYWADERPMTADSHPDEYLELQRRQIMERMVREREERLNATMFDEIEAASIDPLRGFYGPN